ncbi:hypothetical protein FT637_22925 [Bacillus cereus]|uniref:hypothetical protein n=1 Tax=Bacillus cereus TaxID=1396 RepID=UPI001879F753|nr:hypothetical protein [Bacillus cereus]MBE7105767.1 hypothetical protein [Bacillus cereus]MBE7122165.1 hypothetical protein [Bacillus cereus]
MLNERYSYLRRGVNCYWNSMSLLLEQFGLEPLILKHLNFGYVYSNPSLDITFELEAEQPNTLGWLQNYIGTSKSKVAPHKLREFLHNNTESFLLCVDVKVLSTMYPTFPPVHDYHYLNIVGVENENVHVKDQYFGYHGPIPIDLIYNSIQSKKIKQAGEVIKLNIETARINNFNDEMIKCLKYEFLLKLSQYLQGHFQFDGVSYYTGTTAISKLCMEIDQVFSNAMSRQESIQDNWNFLIRRFNTCFLYSREGMLYYLNKYHHIVSLDMEKLINYLGYSLSITRKISFIIMQANLKNKDPQQIIPTLQLKLEELMSVEKDIHKEIDTVYQKLNIMERSITD